MQHIDNNPGTLHNLKRSYNVHYVHFCTMLFLYIQAQKSMQPRKWNVQIKNFKVQMELAGPKLGFRESIQKTFLKIYNVLVLVFTEIFFGGIFYWLKNMSPFSVRTNFQWFISKKKNISGSHDINKSTYISNIYFYSKEHIV